MNALEFNRYRTWNFAVINNMKFSLCRKPYSGKLYWEDEDGFFSENFEVGADCFVQQVLERGFSKKQIDRFCRLARHIVRGWPLGWEPDTDGLK